MTSIFKSLKKGSVLILATMMAVIMCGVAVINPFTASANGYVAQVSVYAYDGNGGSSSINIFNQGHAWLVVDNISDSSIVVGRMTIPAGGTVSIGTFGPLYGRSGLWYNLEGYRYLYEGDFNGRVSLTKSITSSELSTMNVKINSYNDTWNILDNCSSFAKNVYNTVSLNNLTADTPNTPGGLKNSIKNFAYQTNRSFGYNSNVGYYNGLTFVPVSPYGLFSMENPDLFITYDYANATAY